MNGRDRHGEILGQGMPPGVLAANNRVCY